MEKDDFSRAAEHVRGLRGLDDKTMLKLYSLYKQVKQYKAVSNGNTSIFSGLWYIVKSKVSLRAP